MELNLDFSLKTAAERSNYVTQLINDNPRHYFTPQELLYLSNYLLFTSNKDQTKKEKHSSAPILTQNRELTINKREQSFEEIVSSLENGEDGLYSMINQDPSQKLDHRDRITQQDYDEIPGLRDQLTLLRQFSQQFKTATGQRRYQLKKAIIETWQQMYIIRRSYKSPTTKNTPNNPLKNFAHMSLDEEIYLDSDLMPVSTSPLNLLNPTHISFLLCNYSQLKEEVWDDLQNDMHFLLLDLEELTERALKEKYPALYAFVIWKIDGLPINNIQDKMHTHYNEDHSEDYYSKLWRQRIPRIIAKQAQKEYIIWYYTNIEKGNWKKCTKCGEIKPAHPLFYSRNSNKQGWYSQCKDCRNAKEK